MNEQIGIETVSDQLLDQIEGLYSKGTSDVKLKHNDAVKLETFLRNPDFALRKSEAKNMEEVFSFLERPLLEKKYAKRSYFGQIRKDFLANRTAWIYPKVLLLLSDYRFGSFRAGLSLLYLDKPLRVGEEDEVELFLLLSTEEKMAHVPLLFELDFLLENEFLAELRKGYSMFDAFLMKNLTVKENSKKR
ncbi:PTS sugar transporter subunit IIA [Listeria floridensis]|uniref:PTS sugar transporter subunit IIA n=1 Tax=Listeria floridensis TaxID=1494962 RepID=UPI0011EA2BE3|nr:PTS sugar transporter subunit IIA [Listeria floridensis]